MMADANDEQMTKTCMSYVNSQFSLQGRAEQNSNF